MLLYQPLLLLNTRPTAFTPYYKDMDALAFGIFFLSFLIAIAGIILPMLPGVPVAALGAFIAAWISNFETLTPAILLFVGGLALLSVLLDYLAGVIGAQRFGASRAGVWGSVIGALLGIVFFPPLGFLLGALLGAVLAELIAGRQPADAFRSGLGALVGTLGGVVAKLILVIAIGVVVFPRLL